MKPQFKFAEGDKVQFPGVGRGVIKQQVSYWGSAHYTVKFRASKVPHVCHESELVAPAQVCSQTEAAKVMERWASDAPK